MRAVQTLKRGIDKTRCKLMRNLAKIQMSPKDVLPPLNFTSGNKSRLGDKFAKHLRYVTKNNRDVTGEMSNLKLLKRDVIFYLIQGLDIGLRFYKVVLITFSLTLVLPGGGVTTGRSKTQKKVTPGI